MQRLTDATLPFFLSLNINFVSLLADPFGWLADMGRAAVAASLRFCVGVILDAPDPVLNGTWLTGLVATMHKVGLPVLICIVLTSTISAILKGGGMKQLASTFTFGIAVGTLGTAAFMSLVSICLSIDAQLAEQVMNQSTEAVESYYRYLEPGGQNVNPTGSNQEEVGGNFKEAGFSGFIMFLVYLLMGIGMLFVNLELIGRTVMIYAAIVFMPLALSLWAWEPTRKWTYNLMEVVLVLCFAKFIISIFISFGLLSVTQSVMGTNMESGQGMALLLGGLFVVIIACAALPMLIGFIMRPDFQVLGNSAIGKETPWNAGKASASKTARGAIRGLLRRGRK